MERTQAIAGLAALADGTRLSVLSALMRAGEEGLAAGDIAEALDKPPSSLSGPLRHLRLARLIERKKRGKLTVYWAAKGVLGELARFIAELEKQKQTASALSLTPILQGSPAFLGLSTALTKYNLPADDVGGEGQRYFALVDDGGTAFGFGGLEGAGADQLIRSLIIYTPMRGKGAGRALVRLLEAQAKQDGAERIWLLTNDAEKFFARLRYKVADRADAPKAIMRTKQFAKLCPASAKLMVRVVKG
ncbi:MAG: arsenic resistance N-acetyltransferase ArsN2 [Hyphomicrobiales bacterium]